MSQSEEQASPVQIVVMQAEHEMAAVPPADDQMAEAPPEDQIAEAPPEDGITAAGVVEDHITAAGVVEDHITAVAAAAAGVVEEQQIIHVTGVDEHIRNHIVEMENQLRQNVEAVHALQQQNQEIRDALDTSNASIVLLQAELDSRKDELENCQEENKKSRETVETKLRSCQEELQAQSVKGKEMEQKLAETQNSLELKEQEFKELEEKMQEKSEEIEEAVVAPAAQPRVHNTRSRGNQKAKSTTVSTTPATKTKVASAMEIIKQDFVPNTLRFCRTCGAKQLFKVKSEIIGILSGKMELSNRTCAICGNAVSPPKTTSKVKDGEQEESETRTEVTPAKVEKMPKRPSRLAKKRKISDETEEVDNEEAGDKSDKENKGDDMGAPLISYPVDDTPDVDASGDGVAKPSEVKSETGTGEGSETTAGDEGDDVSEPMDTKEDSQNESQNEDGKPLVFPNDRRPGRPRKTVKDKKSKQERTPSNAPVSKELAPLCETDDNEGTMFIDGRKKENRLTYAMLGLDPAVKDMMHPDAKPELPFKCKMATCKTVEFAHVKPFLKHMTTHTGEEPMSHPYRCKDCDKTFKQSRILQIHAMSHAEDRPFKCRFCEAAFKVRSGLWRHVKIHTNPKQHLCNICGQRFQEKRKLQNHEMIHSGELPYKCQHCGEGFRRIESMRRHEKIHTGDRPHVCEFCGRSFKERGDIKKHLVLHTGEKPFKCTLCSYRSSRKEYVKLHMKTHGGGSIYKCVHCDMTFSSQLVCKKHEKEHYEPAIRPEEVIQVDEGQKDKVQEEVIPTTLIINQGDHPHQEMLSAVDFLLQFDSANRVFASSSGQDGTVTYVTQNANTEGEQEPTVAYVTQGEGQEGMVTYVAQHTTSESGQETVTYVTEAAHPIVEGEATTVAYITEEPNPEGGDHEATITYVTQT